MNLWETLCFSSVIIFAQWLIGKSSWRRTKECWESNQRCDCLRYIGEGLRRAIRSPLRIKAPWLNDRPLSLNHRTFWEIPRSATAESSAVILFVVSLKKRNYFHRIIVTARQIRQQRDNHRHFHVSIILWNLSERWLAPPAHFPLTQKNSREGVDRGTTWPDSGSRSLGFFSKFSLNFTTSYKFTKNQNLTTLTNYLIVFTASVFHNFFFTSLSIPIELTIIYQMVS